MRGGQRVAVRVLAPILFALPAPAFAIKSLLLGFDTPEVLFSQVRAAIESVTSKVLSARLRAVLVCNAREALRKTALPILYLQARQDRLVSAQSLKDIQELRPDIAIVAINGPHLLLQRNPQEAAQVVTHFLQQLP